MADKSESIENNWCDGEKPSMTSKNARPVTSRVKKERKGLSIKVDIDVSDALKGLKAVERQAKKTTHSLREVEGMSPSSAISRLSDDDIIKELSKRGWEVIEHGLADARGIPVETFIELKKKY